MELKRLFDRSIMENWSLEQEFKTETKLAAKGKAKIS
jgi:hypothetical protein